MKRSKKIFLLVILFLGVGCTSSHSSDFSVSSSMFSLDYGLQSDSVLKEFDDSYRLVHSISSSKLQEEITILSKKVTYLLLGERNTLNETSQEYYMRRQDYMDLRYQPIIPKSDNFSSGFDEDSQEYKDDLLSGISVPGMFSLLDELQITYSTIGSIRVTLSDDMVLSTVSLPNITIREEDADDPIRYNMVETNLVLYYFFKEFQGEYKLYYLYAEKKEELDEYFEDITNDEMMHSFSISENYTSSLSEVYDTSKLQAVDPSVLNEIYEKNKQNVVFFNAYYNTGVTHSSNGLLISDGLVVTTWSFLEQALRRSQFISVRNSSQDVLEIDGIVTANPEADVAVIKLKEKVTSSIQLGNSENMEVSDAVFTISSKTGVGFTLQSGILTSKDTFLSSLIPLTSTDGGSPLFNSFGEVIGMNTSKSSSQSISLAIDSKVLEEIQNKFSNLSFEQIKTLSFLELKEKYYYKDMKDEQVVNSISSSKWNEIKVIGNLEESVSLPLVKSSMDKNVVSLRYYNSLSQYISGMQLFASFQENLLNQGYIKTLDSQEKRIFQSQEYKVILMEEFDYLIVVMVKL